MILIDLPKLRLFRKVASLKTEACDNTDWKD